jgi:zinc transport system substrate-binding protein
MEKEFKEKLLVLDKNIKDKIKNLKDRILIVAHPSWGHFSNEYGFTQVSMEREGKEIQARSLVRLIKMAKLNNIKAIFTQPQFNDRAAKVIANELNAEIIVLDPLALNYIENMNIVTDSIVKGLARE